MERALLALIGAMTTVILTVLVIRGVSGAKGAELPRTDDGNNIYGIKWQWRALGLASAAFWVIASIWSWHDRHSRPDGVLITLTTVFVMIGVWLASGSVRTNRNGITKRTLWRSRFFQWDDITEIRLHEKQGGAIELRSGPQKLIVDSRFVASQHLLKEIENHTHLRPDSGTVLN
jgi:hypothetical protein